VTATNAATSPSDDEAGHAHRGAGYRTLAPDALCSLIVPAFNAAEFVGEAIEAALAQTYRPLEIVVIDDGSTDTTADIVRGYLHHPEVVLVQQENRGLAGARNRGIDESHGEVVGLLDADDVWMPHKVATAMRHLREHPEIGWFTTDCYLMYDDRRTDERYYGSMVADAFPPADHAEQVRWIAQRNFMSVACLIRRDLFDRFGGFDPRLRRTEDYDLWIRFILGGTCVGRIAEPLGWYRLRDDSLSADLGAQWESHLEVLGAHGAALHAAGGRLLARECYDIARRQIASGHRRRALRFAWMALRAPDTSVRTASRHLSHLGLAFVTPARGARA
jgi:GT2 family glycosyltransferase